MNPEEPEGIEGRDPAMETFEMSQAARMALLSTRKQDLEIEDEAGTGRKPPRGASTGAFVYPGFYGTTNFRGDLEWFLVAIVIEVLSLWALFSVGAFDNLNALFGFWGIDVICAGLAHFGTTNWHLYKVKSRLAQSADERHWTGIYKPRLWKRLLKGFGILGLIASAGLKAVFFWMHAAWSIANVTVVLGYGIAAAIHVSKTGFVFAQWYFLYRRGADFRRYAKQDPTARFHESRRHKFRTRESVHSWRAKNQFLKVDKEVDADGMRQCTLVTNGLLFDEEVKELAFQQDTPAAKEVILRECLKVQVEQLGLNPMGTPQLSKDDDRPGPTFTGASVLLLVAGVACLSVTGCVKAKPRASAIEPVRIWVIGENLGTSRTSPQIEDLVAPFLTSDNKLVIPKTTLLFSDADKVLEADLPFDPEGFTPSVLDRLFGDTSISFDDARTQWASACAHALVLHPCAAKSSALLGYALARGTPDLFLSVKKLNIVPVPSLVSNGVDFQKKVTELLATKAGPEPTILIVLDLPNTSLPTPTIPSLEKKTVPLPEEDRLPESVRSIIRHGTARVVASFYFQPDLHYLSTEDKLKLNRLAVQLQGDSSALIVVVGFADLTGKENWKLVLSKARATEVARGLEKRKIPVLSTLGLGDGLPADQTGTAEGLGLNRRVDVIEIDPGTDNATAQNP